jgi:hypothetical protein
MIPYDLIVPSASRPHLLSQVLGTLLARVDQYPRCVIVHNDERFPGKRALVEAAVAQAVPNTIPVVLHHDDPPIKHGPALKWLLDRVETSYVLYTQDDHKVNRPLPIRQALALLDHHQLNQIRFNKRDTLDKKGREGQEFYKVEHHYGVALDPALGTFETTLCVADHWYFQTGVWRVDAIRPIVNWWAGAGREHGAFEEHMEVKINQVMNGQWRTHHPAWPSVVPVLEDGAWNDPAVRARVHKTFIWGKVGEPAFVEHIGHLPEDWALERANRDPQAVRAAKGQA